MNDNFCIERLWFPAGEGSGTVGDETYFLSMADSRSTFIEWSADDSRKRQRSRVFSGDLWVWPPGQTWWTRREAGKTCIQLSLSALWLHQITHSPFDLPPQVQRRDPLTAQMLRTLAQTATTLPNNPTTTLYQESLVTTMVLHLATHYGQPARKQENSAPLSAVRLRAISEYVSERIAEKISLTDLAHLAGLSASQFSLRFRETTGRTPHQFVTLMRVDRARELLVAGERTPADVAAQTGFADQSHLTRHLRRVFGVTPGALQKR